MEHDQQIELFIGSIKDGTVWDNAPDWAHHVVESFYVIGYVSKEFSKVKFYYKDSGRWLTDTLTKDHCWTEENILATRPEEEEVCQCLTGEILATMDVLNDVGHSQMIAEEFKFHLSLLLEMQRNRLKEK